MRHSVGPASSPPRHRRSSERRPPPALVLTACLTACAAGLPAVYLVFRTVQAPLGEIARVLSDRETSVLLRNTLGLTAAVTASALALGIPAAWLTERSDVPGKRLWAVLHALPVVIPSYLGGYAFVAALGPKGLAQNWLEPLGVERLPEIYGFPGAWLVLTLFTYPYVFLSVRGALLRIDPGLEEAAATLGQRRSTVFFRVVLPQIWPAVASGALLVALYTLHDFGAVSLLRFDSFSRAIYLSYEGSFDRTEAAILSLLSIAISVAVVAVEIRLRPRSSIYRVHGSGGKAARQTSLGSGKWPAFAAFCLLSFAALVIPLAIVALWVWQGLEVRGVAGVAWVAAGNSLSAAGLGAVLAVGAAWPLSALSARYPGRLSRTLEKAGFVAYALPGIVVALALVFFGIRVAPRLYQTRFMLGFAYMILFLPLAVGSLKTSFLQLSPRLDEAARSLGASRWRRFRIVVLPLIRPGLVAGLALVFLSAMKELPATLLLAPIEFPTLATRVWSATHAASFAAAAPPALALVLLSSLPLALLLARDEDRGLFASDQAPIGLRER